MGYTLTIGELEIEYCPDEGEIYLGATGISLDNAPAFGEPTDRTSSRWPAYTVWNDFTKAVGLQELFYDTHSGIIRNHPGCVPISSAIVDEINAASEKFKAGNPGIKAFFPEYGGSAKDELKFLKSSDDEIFAKYEWRPINGHAARLEWLVFWVNYAFENCEKPVFENS